MCWSRRFLWVLCRFLEDVAGETAVVWWILTLHCAGMGFLASWRVEGVVVAGSEVEASSGSAHGSGSVHGFRCGWAEGSAKVDVGSVAAVGRLRFRLCRAR